MTGAPLKYLCAVLNSSLATWWVQSMAATTGMGLTEWTIVTVERIPVPQISTAEQGPLACLVDQILAAKAAKLTADTAVLEREIDDYVFKLYGLTAEEIRAITDR